MAKMFHCDQCDYKVSDKFVFGFHLGKFHPVQGIRKRKCGFCDYSTRDSCDLKRHIEKVCGPDAQMFTCKKENCNFTVSNKVVLSRHEAQCEKDTENSDLPIIVNVESRRELACELCDHVAFTKLALKAHMKVMHKDASKHENKSTERKSGPEEPTKEALQMARLPKNRELVIVLKKLIFQ